MQMDIKQAIAELGLHDIKVQRAPSNFSFGTKAECREMFIETFKAVDLTVQNYQHLPEYDQVIEWMVEPRGRGLFLAGNCGRGKSIILTGVIPTLMYVRFKKVLKYYHSEEIPAKVDEIVRGWAILIDELGVEPMVTNYGEKYEGFNRLINTAENRLSPLFVTTNLTMAEIQQRYGERTLDRIARLCRVVKFKGGSLR